MSLSNVWLATLADGLIRADHVIGIHTHPTPAVTGKPSRWLLDVVLGSTTGSGQHDTWAISPLHRTLIQTAQQPTEAPQCLARLLAHLDNANASGIISCTIPTRMGSGSDEQLSGIINGDAVVRFRFNPFQATEPECQSDPDYL